MKVDHPFEIHWNESEQDSSLIDEPNLETSTLRICRWIRNKRSFLVAQFSPLPLKKPTANHNNPRWSPLAINPSFPRYAQPPSILSKIPPARKKTRVATRRKTGNKVVDKIHLLVLATFGESHEGDGSVELIFVVARKKREREGEKMAGCTYKAGTHKGLGGCTTTYMEI